MNLQKLLKFLDSLLNNKIAQYAFSSLTIGSVTRTFGLRMSDNFENAKLIDLGSLDDLRRLIRSIVERDIEYIGADNSVLSNLLHVMTVEDIKFLNIPILRDIEFEDNLKLSDLVDYSTVVTCLEVLINKPETENERIVYEGD